ncbi:MAG TPA: DUF3990 domain-containing protein, partial [Gemmataceae bacterium]|nr:DUF3990 domain-containing protein [Gemmataceae bacterium]
RAVPVPPNWMNQSIALFHGTLDTHANAILSKGVNTALGRRHTDFGQGFYTTTVEQQARSWAWQLSLKHTEMPRLWFVSMWIGMIWRS